MGNVIVLAEPVQYIIELTGSFARKFHDWSTEASQEANQPWGSLALSSSPSASHSLRWNH